MKKQDTLKGVEEGRKGNQISIIKMQIDKSKLKNEFKKRLYNFALRLIEFLDKLPKDNVSKRLGDQLLRSGTSIVANYVPKRKMWNGF